MLTTTALASNAARLPEGFYDDIRDLVLIQILFIAALD